MPIATTPRRCVPGLGNAAQPGPRVVGELHLGDRRPLDRHIPLVECERALGARQHDLELSRVEQQGHHAPSLPAGAGRAPGDLLTGRTTIGGAAAPLAVQDWFGDPARARASRRRLLESPTRPRASRRRRAPRRSPMPRHCSARQGADFERMLAARRRHAGCRAGGIRSSRRHHVLAQGVRPAHHAVPRPLPLLHLRRHPRAAAQDAQAGVHVARAGAHRRPAGRRRSAAKRRCSPSATAPKTAGPRRGRGSTSTASPRRSTTSGTIARLITAETGLLAHLNPGVMTRGRAADAAPHRPVDGDDARDDVAAAVRRARSGALRLARQGSRRCAWP